MSDEKSRLLGDQEEGWWKSPRSREGPSALQAYLPRPLTVVCIVWIVGGVYLAQVFEGWDFLTSLYVITQIVTTIGYGDITVSSPQAKIFCAFYVAGTLVLIGTALTDIADSILRKNTEYLKAKIRQIEDRITTMRGLPPAEPPAADPQSSQANKALATFAVFALFVGFGTVFYAVYESCSCSFGPTKVEGCMDGSQGRGIHVNLSWEEAKALERKCYETGGHVLTWIDAFYMSVITLTTVGFGDHSPKTQLGRAIGIGWMVLGVVACGAFVSTFGALILQMKKERKLGGMSHEIFSKIDTDGDNELSRSEFRIYCLLKFDLMSQTDLEEIDRMFNSIDTDKNGMLTYEEIIAHCDHEHV